MPEIALEGGTAHGAYLDTPSERDPVLLRGDGVPEGWVARYRPTKRRDEQGRCIFQFSELDQIVATVPMPGGEG